MFFQRLQSACTAFSNAWKNPILTASQDVSSRSIRTSQPGCLTGDQSDGITIVHTTRGIRYLGIQEEASRLGVNRVHLWQVLSGKRTSKSLMKRVRIKEAK